MKTYPFLILIFLLSSCALKVNQTEARTAAENLLTDLKNNNYTAIDKYYTDLSNESEPLEKKKERFEQLKSITGSILSFEFESAKEEYDSDKGLNQLELKYKVKCERVILLQTFLFINDEGSSKIIFQNIENLK
ncbi:hypothetical protein BH11BAC1_BH11BAC1_00760 [soil metagenome]